MQVEQAINEYISIKNQLKENMNRNVEISNQESIKWNQENPNSHPRPALQTHPLIRFGWQPFVGSPNVIPFINQDELSTNVIYKAYPYLFIMYCQNIPYTNFSNLFQMLLKNSDIIAKRRTAFLHGQPIPDTMSSITFELWSKNSPHNVAFSDFQRHLMRVDKSLDGCLEDIFVLEKEAEKLQTLADERKRTIERLERTVREKQEEINASAPLRAEVESLKKRLDSSANEKEIQTLKLNMAVQESKLRQFQKDHELMEQFREQLSAMEVVCNGSGASSGIGSKRKSGDS